MKDIKKLNKGNFTRNNWQLKKLGDVCDIVKDMPKEFSGEKKYFSTGAVGNDYLDLPDNVTYKNRPSRANIYPKIGDIGFAKMKFTNKVLLINSDLNGSIFSTGFCFLRPSILLDSKYLFHFIISDEFQKIKDDYAGDGIMGGIKNSNIINIEIPIPSLSEQKRITKLLDDTFKKLEKVKENNKKNLQNSKELFESYLNNIFSKTRKDWEEKTLKEVCEKITDGTHQTPTYSTNGFIFLSSKNVTSGKIDWDNVRYIDKKQHLEMQKRVSPRKNDILLAKNGTTGVAALVDKDEIFDIYVSLAQIRSLKFIYPNFLLYFINSLVAKNQFNKRLKGSGVPNLHLEEIREVVIHFPKSIQEQKQIVRKLDQLSEKTKKLEEIYKNKLEDIEELKKSLLHKAFNGEL